MLALVALPSLTLFKNAFVFVAPSHSEVIGMVNLEAAILQTPVITTFQTGLLKDWSKNGGFLIEPTENEILKRYPDVLEILLCDQTTKNNIYNLI